MIERGMYHSLLVKWVLIIHYIISGYKYMLLSNTKYRQKHLKKRTTNKKQRKKEEGRLLSLR